MNFGSIFLDFCKEKGFGRWENIIEGNQVFTVTLDELQEMINLKTVSNGMNGGLILGNLHSEGGIHLLTPISENKLKYSGEMEGWEYLTGPLKNEKALIEFESLNAKIKNIDSFNKTDFEIPKRCKVIDVRGLECPILVLSEFTHFIVNRLATKTFINDIVLFDEDNYLKI